MVTGLKHQKEKRSMDHFAGLDVSVKETSVCIVDDTGRIVREVKVASEPEALLTALKSPSYHFKRIGLEAGPLSQWLFSALAEAELPVVCVETRHMQAVLKAQINKTDRNDARGIAHFDARAALVADRDADHRAAIDGRRLELVGRFEVRVETAVGVDAGVEQQAEIVAVRSGCGRRTARRTCSSSLRPSDPRRDSCRSW